MNENLFALCLFTGLLIAIIWKQYVISLILMAVIFMVGLYVVIRRRKGTTRVTFVPSEQIKVLAEKSTSLSAHPTSYLSSFEIKYESNGEKKEEF